MVEEVVKVGETVQEIKRKMCSASKIPSHSVFLLNGTPMLDPLSLNDIPGVVGHTRLKIEVKVCINPHLPLFLLFSCLFYTYFNDIMLYPPLSMYHIIHPSSLLLLLIHLLTTLIFPASDLRVISYI